MNIFHRKQRGFTLMELVIVVIIIGFLATIYSRQFNSGISDSARSQTLWEHASKIAINWSLLNQAAATASVITGSPVPASGKTVMDVVVGGAPNVAAAYQIAWKQSGLSPLTDIAQQTPTAGTYTISGYPVALSGGGANPLQVTYSNVPDAVTQLLVTKYGTPFSQTQILGTSDTTNPNVQYSAAATDGTRTVTIVKQM